MDASPIDEATAQFLLASGADLQRQLGIGDGVEVISVERTRDGVGLRARIGVREHSIEVDGWGETLVAAHADLCRRGIAQLELAAAFRDVMESQLRRDP